MKNPKKKRREGLNAFSFTPDFLKEPFRDWAEKHLQDFGVHSGEATLHLFGIRDEIIERIRKYDTTVGCSPWFNASSIKQELVKKKKFSIVSNDDEWDLNDHKQKDPTHKKYFPVGLVQQCDESSWPMFRINDPASAYAVEYVRTYKAPRVNARLHSKFLVFMEMKDGKYTPAEAMIGSFNMNDHPTHSFECMLSIRNPRIMGALVEHWRQILMCALYQRDQSLINIENYQKLMEEAEKFENEKHSQQTGDGGNYPDEMFWVVKDG